MPDSLFSLLCCRNLVFTYFEQNLQTRLLNQFLTRLRPGGVLMLGTGESICDDADVLTQPRDSLPLYRHRPS